MKVQTLRSLGAFDELASEWDSLVEAMPRPSPFMLHGWLRAQWALADAPRVVVVRRVGRLSAALPLDIRRRGRLRVAELIGGMDAHLGDALGDVTLVRTLLDEAARSRFDYADFFGMPAASRLGSVPGFRLIERVEAPVLDLKGGWDAVYAARASTKTRQTHRRKLNRLGDQGRVEFALATAPDEVAAALEETFRIHELRWHGRRDGSGLERTDVRDAQRAAYRALAGTARILTLSLDGKAIAYNCALVVGKRLYSHRLAFDPAYAHWSPGLLCTLELCARASAEGIDRIEFLGGAEDYKLQLADRPEPLYEAVGLAQTVRGRAVVGARLGLVHARRRLKRFRRLHRLYVEGFAPARRARASA